MGSIALVIADKERAFAQLLARSLDALPEMHVTGSTQAVSQIEHLVATTIPDVVVFDASLAPRRLVELHARLRALVPDVALVVTAADNDPLVACEALLAGARAFVAKSVPLDQMREAITGAVLGETWIEPTLLTHVIDRLLDDPEEDDDERRLGTLTPREAEVLECMVEGLDQPRIARSMGLSVNTIRTHTQNILTKLEVHSRLEAVSVALRAGFPGRRERHPVGRHWSGRVRDIG